MFKDRGEEVEIESEEVPDTVKIYKILGGMCIRALLEFR